MKKIVILIFMVATAISLISCNRNYDLVLFLPNDYMEEDIVKAFEKEYKVKVGIINFNSNEVALKQIKENPNSYDLIIPSDYAMEELVALDLVETIDWTKLSNIKKTDLATDLIVYLDELKDEGFDVLKYSIPYYWGSIGLLYNNQVAGLKELVETEGWKALENKNYSKMLYDSSRDAIMVGLAKDNILLKDATQTDITNAANWLKMVKKDKASIKSDEILDEAIGNRTPYDIAIVYSGDATYIIQENEFYNYFIPSQTNIWIDSFVIPKNSKDKDLAYKFIDWFSEKENQIENTLEIGYTPIRQDVINYILENEEDFQGERLQSAFLVSGVETYEFYRYNQSLFDMIASAWIDVKNN